MSILITVYLLWSLQYQIMGLAAKAECVAVSRLLTISTYSNVVFNIYLGAKYGWIEDDMTRKKQQLALLEGKKVKSISLKNV